MYHTNGRLLIIEDTEYMGYMEFSILFLSVLCESKLFLKIKLVLQIAYLQNPINSTQASQDWYVSIATLTTDSFSIFLINFW